MPTPNQKKPVRYMDFISRKPSANSDPLASRPVPRRIEKPKPVVKKISSVSDQIPQKGTQKPEPRVEKTEQKPLVSRKPVTSRDLYPENHKPEEKPKVMPTPAKETPPSAPDGNKYALGGKSPFLENYTVDKRPLSKSVPKKKTDNFEKLSFLGVNEAGADSGRKNVYEKGSAKSETKKKDKKKDKTVKIIDDSDKKKGAPIIVVILITLLLGAAVGAGVYFLLPK